MNGSMSKIGGRPSVGGRPGGARAFCPPLPLKSGPARRLVLEVREMEFTSVQFMYCEQAFG